MSAELKPCPFCGYHGSENGYCGSCGARGPIYEPNGDYVKDAAAAWNTRAPSPELEAEREKVRVLQARLDEFRGVETINSAGALTMKWMVSRSAITNAVNPKAVIDGAIEEYRNNRRRNVKGTEAMNFVEALEMLNEGELACVGKRLRAGRAFLGLCDIEPWHNMPRVYKDLGAKIWDAKLKLDIRERRDKELVAAEANFRTAQANVESALQALSAELERMPGTKGTGRATALNLGALLDTDISTHTGSQR